VGLSPHPFEPAPYAGAALVPPIAADLRLDARDRAVIRELRPEAVAAWAATAGSALFSALLYGGLWGAPIACGLVLGMWVHELGHRAALRRFGLESSPIVFVPFVGAVQRVRAGPENAAQAALVALAGPACGVLFAAACKLGHATSGDPVLRFLATAHALLALIDLLPFGMLDGKVVVAALSRAQRIASACAATALTVACASPWLIPICAALAFASARPGPERGEPWLAAALVALLGAALCVS
jgi:Zn-dependent protease